MQVPSVGVGDQIFKVTASLFCNKAWENNPPIQSYNALSYIYVIITHDFILSVCHVPSVVQNSENMNFL